MSFSADVKEELSKLSNLANKVLVKAEMYGYLNSTNIMEENGALKYTTESEYNINRFSKLLNNLNINKYDIDISGKNFSITIPKKEASALQSLYTNYTIDDDENIEKAFVRGTFLGSGSINNPKNKYHIEVSLNKLSLAEEEVKILEKYGISFKILNFANKNKALELNKDNGQPKSLNNKKDINEKNVKKSENIRVSIYSKDGEEISKFLAFIGASSSVLKFEEIRVYRDMRNNVNRIVNCETANLAKTVDAAVKQINAINKLKKNGKFNDLPENLKELANLRVENPEASLAELGKMLKEPIGKSGVNYRLKTLINLSL